jgi:membrane fusion protein (multidrug efflux system)
MSVYVRRGVALAALVAGVGLAGCGPADANGADEMPPETGRVLNVEVATVEPIDFIETVRLTGTVGANRDVTVSAEESGVVVEILVEKGASVAAGQPILRIDDRLLASQAEQARAQAALANELWERRRRLFEEDKVGSELAYLEARYQAEQARANLATLQRRLERAVVTAPIEGVLDARMVEVGTMVNPGTPVVRIVDMDPVKVIGGVPERLSADIRTGARATVTFDALEGQTFAGNINYVGAAIDPSNRTFPVEFGLPNPGRAVKPEMVANIEVVRRTIEDALVVPQESLLRVEDGYVVYVIVDDLAVAKPVTVGASQQNQTVITSGLESGDVVVVVGQQQLAAGDRVRIVGEG